MAASFAALARVQQETEKTIQYKPDEACAYRYLTECYTEMKASSQAVYWYDEMIKREPLIMDRNLLCRVKSLLADSLLETGQCRAAAMELDSLLEKLDLIGEEDYENSNLFLKLGYAHHRCGDVKQAVAAWRRGIDRDEDDYSFVNYNQTLMAESLAAYSPSFNKDSLKFYLKSFPSTRSPAITGPILIFPAIGLSFTTWFVLGFVFFMIALMKKENVVLLQRKDIGRTLADYSLYMLLPSLLIPVILMLIAEPVRLPGFYFLLISEIGSIIGILLLIRITVRRAREDNVSIKDAISATLIPAWLMAVMVFGIFASLILMAIWLISVIVGIY